VQFSLHVSRVAGEPRGQMAEREFRCSPGLAAGPGPNWPQLVPTPPCPYSVARLSYTRWCNSVDIDTPYPSSRPLPSLFHQITLAPNPCSTSTKPARQHHTIFPRCWCQLWSLRELDGHLDREGDKKREGNKERQREREREREREKRQRGRHPANPSRITNRWRQSASPPSHPAFSQTHPQAGSPLRLDFFFPRSASVPGLLGWTQDPGPSRRLVRTRGTRYSLGLIASKSVPPWWQNGKPVLLFAHHRFLAQVPLSPPKSTLLPTTRLPLSSLFLSPPSRLSSRGLD
jgi:hypothetical protein